MSRLDLRACLDQGIRKLHPLPIHQITSYPSPQFETAVVLENQRRRLARDYLPGHLRLSALVAPGNIHGLRFALRRKEKYKGSSRDAARQSQAHPAISHRDLHFQVAWLRAALPGHWYRCNSQTNEFCTNTFICNNLQTGPAASIGLGGYNNFPLLASERNFLQPPFPFDTARALLK